MFTILVRHKDGNEEILENMKSPRRICTPGAGASGAAGDVSLSDSGFYAEYTDGHAHAYYPHDGCGDLIFVMNDKGATIAKYQL